MNRHQRRANAKLQRKSNDPYTAAETLSNLGIALRAQGKLDEAIATFRRAIRVKPDVALFHFNLGAMLHECRRFDEAIVAYRQAIQIKSDYAEAYSNLGTALRDLDKLEEAITVQRQAIRLKPSVASAHCNLGAALYDQGRLEEAIASYRQAISLEPNFDVAHGNLGAALIELGRSSEGRSTLEHAVRLAPRNIKHRRYLGELEPYTAGDLRLAELERLACDAARLSVDDRIELHFTLGKAYDDTGWHAEAFRQWRDGNALKRQHVAYNEAATLDVLDRIRSVFTPELMRARQKAGHPSSVPVFIVGMPRSGTTLVEQILASHPQVFGAGELKHLDAAIKGIRMPEVVFPDIVPDMADTDFRELGARYIAETEKLAPAAKRIIDKRPTNFQLAGLIHLALPNAFIIHTIRDPIDTCLSCFSKLFADKWVQTYDLAELGRYYRNYQKLMVHWERVLPIGRILNVRYEDVITDLEGQARRIVAHCGLDWDSRCLTYYKTERPVRTASAVQVRKPIYNSAIGRGRAYEPFLGPLLTELQ